MTEPVRARGIFFVANDAVYDLVVPFLNSLRAHNPDIELCFIPFDDRIARLCSLADKYRFWIFDNLQVLLACDAISRTVHGSVKGHYRKLACFEGPFQEFIYIDCDTIVTQDPAFCFPLLANFDFLFSHSDEARLVRWVWSDGIRASGLLSQRQIAFSANTGFMVSRRQALRVAEVPDKQAAIAAFKPYMELACVEQPLLNLLVVTSGKRYGSLLALVKSGTCPDLPLEKWAGGSLLSTAQDSVDHVTNNFFLYHWAGSWAPTKFDAYINAIAQWVFPRFKAPTVRRFLPNGRLWRRYRDMDH